MYYFTKIKSYNGDLEITNYQNPHYIGFFSKKGHNHSVKIDNNSFYKSKMRVRDYILCNDFDFFFTFTFKKNKNFEDCLNKTLNWFKNIGRNKDFKYLFIFELHKKGGVHIHGVCNDINFNLSNSINPYNHQIIEDLYNLNDWHFGFSTISKIKDKNALATYILKYITKSSIKIMKHRYYCSRNLNKPRIYCIPQIKNLVAVKPLLLNKINFVYGSIFVGK